MTTSVRIIAARTTKTHVSILIQGGVGFVECGIIIHSESYSNLKFNIKQMSVAIEKNLTNGQGRVENKLAI